MQQEGYKGKVARRRSPAWLIPTATRTTWRQMHAYSRFEQVISWILTFAIGIIILIALFRLLTTVYQMLVVHAMDPLQPQVFQDLFGMIMTLMIAMEFNHSIQQAVERKHSIIQVKTVLLIAILALARKFIIIDVQKTEASEMIALAVALLVLGLVYWLMRERDDRQAVEGREPLNPRAQHDATAADADRDSSVS